MNGGSVVGIDKQILKDALADLETTTDIHIAQLVYLNF